MISWWALNNLERREEMSRGTDCTGEMPDYYKGIKKEEDEAVKLTKAVEDWWDELTADEKYTIYCYENNINDY